MEPQVSAWRSAGHALPAPRGARVTSRVRVRLPKPQLALTQSLHSPHADTRQSTAEKIETTDIFYGSTIGKNREDRH